MIVFAVRNLAMLVTIAGVFGAARAAAQPQDAQLSLTPKIGLYISPGEIVERVHLSNATTLGLAFEVG